MTRFGSGTGIGLKKAAAAMAFRAACSRIQIKENTHSPETKQPCPATIHSGLMWLYNKATAVRTLGAAQHKYIYSSLKSHRPNALQN